MCFSSIELRVVQFITVLQLLLTKFGISFFFFFFEVEIS